MKKLSILSAFLFWSIFWISLYIVLSYILDAHGIREHFSGGWFGHIWFSLSVLSVNVGAWFFPVYYLQLVSFLRKIQRENERDYKAGKSEPYFYDLSGFFHKIRQNFNGHVERDVKSFIWDYKDAIRDKKIKDKEKLNKKVELAKNI
jgi:hypothetical protein